MAKQNAACLVSYIDEATNLRYYLMVRHKQKKASHTPRYMFAGGNVENDETPIAAARRELQEETGLKIRPNEQLQPLRSYTNNHQLIHLFHLEIDGYRKVEPKSDVGEAEFICEKDIDFNNKTIRGITILDSNFDVINKIHQRDATKSEVKIEQSSSFAILKTLKPTTKPAANNLHPLDDNNYNYEDSINTQLAISLVDTRADELKSEAATMGFFNPNKYIKLRKAQALGVLATNLKNGHGNNYYQIITDARRTHKILDQGRLAKTKELLDLVQRATDPTRPREPRFASSLRS
jgi:ADP-ribose pyrophosphatase YjhB (NUDIX family)